MERTPGNLVKSSSKKKTGFSVQKKGHRRQTWSGGWGGKRCRRSYHPETVANRVKKLHKNTKNRKTRPEKWGQNRWTLRGKRAAGLQRVKLFKKMRTLDLEKKRRSFAVSGKKHRAQTTPNIDHRGITRQCRQGGGVFGLWIYKWTVTAL